MSQGRLRHYNEVLLEQARVLEAQVQGQLAVFRGKFGLTARDVRAQHVDQALSQRTIEARALVEQLKRDSKKLDDPR